MGASWEGEDNQISKIRVTDQLETRMEGAVPQRERIGCGRLVTLSKRDKGESSKAGTDLSLQMDGFSSQSAGRRPTVAQPLRPLDFWCLGGGTK